MPYHFIVEASNVCNTDEKRYIWLEEETGFYFISDDKPDHIIEPNYLYYLLLDAVIPESLYTYSKTDLLPNRKILSNQELSRGGVIYDKMLLTFSLLSKSR
jgi:hypothetical protein